MKINLFFRKFKIQRRRIKRKKVVRRKKLPTKKYLEHKEAARELVVRRLEYFNQHYKLKIGRIAIRNQKSRWGSCSSKGNLNFNYKIVLIPPHLADYVIAHELCHLGQLNHSQKFWDLLGETIPDYENRRMELRKIII